MKKGILDLEIHCGTLKLIVLKGELTLRLYQMSLITICLKILTLTSSNRVTIPIQSTYITCK